MPVAAAGALVATRIPMTWFKPIVLVLLVAVGGVVALRRRGTVGDRE